MTDRTTPFERLVRRHRGEILAYLRRFLGGDLEAEDVAQDTWLRAHRAFDRLPADANQRAWLYRIATNRALTTLRRRRRTLGRSSEVEIEGLPTATVDLDAGVSLRAVGRAVAALPAKQRAALIGRRFQGLAYEELAVTLGCSAEAARANVYQAIRKLRVTLERPS